MNQADEFDNPLSRAGTWSTKWNKYPEDVLPFWVADMDFRAPEFVLQAIRERLDHGIVGYTEVPDTLVESFIQWLAQRHGWKVHPDWLVWLPGVVPGLNLGAKAALAVDERQALLIPTPVYYPFLDVPQHCGGIAQYSALQRVDDRWCMDTTHLTACAPDSAALLISNPQNPTGRAYSRAELEPLVELTLEHNLTLISDEIHSAIMIDPEATHTPIAAMHPDLADRTISLYAPTKTYNIPGLSCAVAVIPNRRLRAAFMAAREGLINTPGPLAYAACEAAFRDESDWVSRLLAYLRTNHRLLQSVVGDRMAPVEATYLGWIDVGELGIQDVQAHFLRHGLGLSWGEQFAGPGFVRFNFAAPRSILEEGLRRLDAALN